jgi:hypothetical protein
LIEHDLKKENFQDIIKQPDDPEAVSKRESFKSHLNQLRRHKSIPLNEDKIQDL